MTELIVAFRNFANAPKTRHITSQNVWGFDYYKPNRQPLGEGAAVTRTPSPSLRLVLQNTNSYIPRPVWLWAYPACQWVPGSLSPGIKRPEREADDSPDFHNLVNTP
jgi:hypothetical protein